MAGVSGMLTTHNGPNYEGPLYNITPEDTPLLSAIGGLNAGVGEHSTVFSWQEHDLRDVAVRVALEGAASPAGTARARANVFNVLQIILELVQVSDTKQAAYRQLADVGSAHPNIVATGQGNPVMSEMDWQTIQMLKQIARDIEHTALNGTFQEPADNVTERKTRGLIAAISTNAVDVAVNSDAADSGSSSSDDLITAAGHGLSDGDKIQFTALSGGAGLVTNKTYYVVSAATNTFQVAASSGGAAIDFTTDIASGTFEQVRDVTSDDIVGLMQQVWDDGGIRESETAVLIANSWNLIKLNAAFLSVSGAGFRQNDRQIGGTNLQTVLTPFGKLGVMLDRYCPENTVVVSSLEELVLHWLEQDEGRLRLEDLPRDGIRDRKQFSGEWGLEYGNERSHGAISGLSTR